MRFMKSTEPHGFVVGLAVVVGATVDPVVAAGAGFVVAAGAFVVELTAGAAVVEGEADGCGALLDAVDVVVAFVVVLLLAHPVRTATHTNNADATVLPR
jgi:hypothetical protein